VFVAWLLSGSIGGGIWADSSSSGGVCCFESLHLRTAAMANGETGPKESNEEQASDTDTHADTDFGAGAQMGVIIFSIVFAG
jgi:hypothetical protein